MGRCQTARHEKKHLNPPVQRLNLEFAGAATTALGLSLWCATAALAFDAQGHRGARGLAPENTLAAFDRALSIGVTTLELDVVLSAEGVPVISHDTTPNPDLTRDAGGRWLQARGQPFNRLTLAEIAEWDVGRINPASRYARDFAEQTARDGQRIPTLAACSSACASSGAAGALQHRAQDPRPPPDGIAQPPTPSCAPCSTSLPPMAWRGV